MKSLDYFIEWMRLECIGVDGRRLYRVPGSTCDDIELAMVADFNGEIRYFFSHALTQGVIDNFLMDPDPAYLPAFNETRQEMAYNFLDQVSVVAPDAIFLGDTAETFDTFAIMDGIAVASRAWSVRRNDTAAEIAVETKEGYRRRGYGKQVVAAWVNYQLGLGKEAIYSHRSGNLESKYLAESVGANRFVEVVSYHL